MGISCLKSYLNPYGYDVKTADANVESEARSIYNEYFDIIRNCIDEEKMGNFYNIGHEVMQNHFMAHLNNTNEEEYIRLVKILVYKTYFFNIDKKNVRELNAVVGKYYNWLKRYFLELIAGENPHLLGISVYKGSLPSSMFAFKITRENFPHIQTVMGGAVFSQTLGPGTPNFDFFLEKTKDYIDKIIIGEGEVLFLRLLQGKLPYKQRVFTAKDIGNEIMDLNSADIPDFSDLNMQLYPNFATYSSRSCPFQCNFCTETVYWGKYRKKSVKKLVMEFRRLYEIYHSQLFLMCDSLLNPIITELARELEKADFSIYWDGYLKVDKFSCDKSNALLWRRGGLYRARLGIESGSQAILKQMNKKTTIQQMKTSIANLAHVGVKTTTYWIIGYPGETEDDFQQTLAFLEELKDDVYEAECNPFGFYLTGQVNSDEWRKQKKATLLYPEKAREMLIVQTWNLESEPSREETYKRVKQFVNHCARLGIPNPYSLYDIYNADRRWIKLHKRAVPPLAEFKNKNIYINENKRVERFVYAQNSLKDKIIFDF